MSSHKRPWFKWYPKDFVADEKVKCLTPLAELVYRRALDLIWQSNDLRIPNAMPLLYQSLGNGMSENDFDLAWGRIQYPDFELFRVTEDQKWVFSARLIRESQEVVDTVNKRQVAGIKGATARWKKPKQSQCQTHSKRIANAYQTNSNTDTDTDINKPPISPDEKANDYSKSFLDWWGHYPKRVAKDKAYDSWKTIGRKKTTTPSELIDAIKAQVAANHFAGKDGEVYIPNPATWLNQGRWKDEIQNGTGRGQTKTNQPPLPPKEFDFANQFHSEE